MILNFTVPKELYSQIDDYDVQKPKVVAASSTAKPRKVNNFHKAGIPEQLIPVDILPKQRLIDVIQTLNTQENDNWYYAHRSIYVGHNDNKILITKKANRYWFAVWFNTKTDSPVFSYSICLRNLKSHKDLRRGGFWVEHSIKEEDFVNVKHNKKDYLYFYKSVTKEDLINRDFNQSHIVLDDREEEFFNPFKSKISDHILVWDKYSVFEAYKTSMASLVGCYHKSNDFSWSPDYKYIISKLNVSKVFKDKLETPFFRKKLNTICQKFIDQYQSKDFDRWSCKFEYRFIEILNFVDDLYASEISVDYLQQMWIDFEFDTNADSYRYYRIFYLTDDLKNWFKENVPIKSFINMYCKDYQLMSDTIGMIIDILKKNQEIKYTGRWRAQDFHDWVMEEQWKLCNKNEKLPQDLFPAPIRVDKMTFIQPINTHQLAKWGREVRNCVGSSTYINGINKKTHFIILGLKNNEPYLTIQARLENENLKVIQIKKTCNANLTHLEEQECSLAFKKALMIRAQEVANAIQ